MLKVDDVVVVKRSPFRPDFETDCEYIGGIGVVESVEKHACGATEYATKQAHRSSGGTIDFYYYREALIKIGNLNE